MIETLSERKPLLACPHPDPLPGGPGTALESIRHDASPYRSESSDEIGFVRQAGWLGSFGDRASVRSARGDDWGSRFGSFAALFGCTQTAAMIRSALAGEFLK